MEKFTTKMADDGNVGRPIKVAEHRRRNKKGRATKKKEKNRKGKRGRKKRRPALIPSTAANQIRPRAVDDKQHAIPNLFQNNSKKTQEN